MFVEEKSEGEKKEVRLGFARLSDAIRVGAKLRGQCRGQYFIDGKSCALGAAYEALYGFPSGRDNAHSSQFDLYRAIWEKIPKPKGIDPIWDIGMTRNDRGWTREQIADWLESQGY